MRNVRIEPLAKRELAKAAAYYDRRSPGLGDGFLIEIGKALRQLSSSPLSCPVVRGDIRKRPLFKFPYSVLYRVFGRAVQVVAIMHQARGPAYIAERLRKPDPDDSGE